MIDLEQRLREYGRDADREVPPFDLGDLQQSSSPPPAPPLIGGRVRRRPVSWIGLAAAVLVIAGLGAVVVVGGGDEAVAPVTDGGSGIPSPDGDTFVTATSVGAISWQRFVGSVADLPARVTGTEDGALAGVDHDSSILYRSTDGGRSWERTVGDGVRTTVGGIEWIVRAGGDAPAVLSWMDRSGERVLDLPDLDVTLPDGFVVETSALPPSSDDPPVFDLGGRTFVAVTSAVRPDWDLIVGTSAWRQIDVESQDGRRGWTMSRGDVAGESFEFSLVDSGGGAELVDEGGNTVLALDSPIPGLEGAEVERLVEGSTAAVRFFEFLDGELLPVETPWPPGQFVHPVAIDGGVAAFTIGWPDQVPSLWHSDDGRQWAEIELPTDSGYINPARDGLVIGGRGSNADRFWTSTDGLTFVEIPAAPAVEQRSQGTFGWVTAQADSSRSRVFVSPDAAAWEEVPLREALDVEGLPGDAFIDAIALGEQIVVTLTDGDLRVLLVGIVLPTTP